MFNLLGPQSNPAGARRHMLGVFDRRWVEPVAAALLANQAVSAWVVHGDGGLDELSTTGPSPRRLDQGRQPHQLLGHARRRRPAARPLADLKGGDPAHNAARMRELFDGVKTPYRDVVILNAAAALIVAGRADTLKLGADLAAREIDSGRAKATLQKLIHTSNA